MGPTASTVRTSYGGAVPGWFLVYFAALGVLSIVVRLLRPDPRRDLRRVGSRIGALTLAVGSVGLGYHCAVMFYPAEFRGPLSLGGYATAVQRLQGWSVVAFVVPAVLVLAGLLHAPRWYPATVAAALIAVGVTMYAEGFSLDVHLATIFVVVTLLVLGVPMLLPRPRRASNVDAGTTPAT